MLYLTHDKPHHTPWNKSKITGQKPPLKPNEAWALRIRLQIADKNVTSHSLILLSIANYVVTIWFRYVPRQHQLSINNEPWTDCADRELSARAV